MKEKDFTSQLRKNYISVVKSPLILGTHPLPFTAAELVFGHLNAN